MRRKQELNKVVRRCPGESFFPEIFEYVEQPWTFRFPRYSLPLLGGTGRWAPTVDVYEKDGQLIAQIDLPGLTRDDVEVSLVDGTLVIKGDRNTKRGKDEKYYRAERATGRFYRRIPLPFPIKADELEASFENGVLTVRMPKPSDAEQEIRQIRIP